MFLITFDKWDFDFNYIFNDFYDTIFTKINLEAIMQKVIQWCNTNQGFISAVLTMMTILISILTLRLTSKIGKMPFKKQFSVNAFHHREKGRNFITVVIVNHGAVSLLIEQIQITDGKGLNIGFKGGITPIVIKPSDFHKETIEVYDDNNVIKNNSVDLNKHIEISIYESDKTVTTTNNCFGVG